MPKRSSKPKRQKQADLNTLAASIVAQATGETLPAAPAEPWPDGKNPAAVALGKLGGMKGGPARAKKLSAKKRAEIAKKAAKARWKRRGTGR